MGGTVEAPANPEKTGYDFAGWKNGDALFVFSTPITTNITLKAEWTLHNYTITYKNVKEHENPGTYTIEDEIILKDPTKGTDPEKTIFVQWCSDDALKNPIEGKIAKDTTGNQTFYAEWSDKAVYTVTFNTDDGSEVAAQRVKDGEKATKPETDPTKEGYTFKGWDFDFTTPITGNKTVNANWEIKKYTVKFMNGETEVKKTEVEYNSTIPEKDFPSEPTKEGYGDFLGWYSGANRFDSNTPIKSDTILNATFGISVTKNADGSYSFADGTYKAVWEGDNAIIRFKLPEEANFSKGNGLRLTGTFDFGKGSQYKQLYIQTVDAANEPLFGFNMIADWKDNGLLGEKSEPVLGLLSKDLTVSDCRFVMGSYIGNVATDKPELSIRIEGVKLTYVEYEDTILFDPEKDWKGETTEIDGETYAVVTVDGYDTVIDVNAVDCSKVSMFLVKCAAKEKNTNFNLKICIKDKDTADISSPSYNQVDTSVKEISAGFDEKTDWNKISETKIAEKIQPMVQDSSNNYAEQSDVVVYIGKIVAKTEKTN